MNEINLKLDSERHCSIENNVLRGPRDRSESLNVRLPACIFDLDLPIESPLDGASVFRERKFIVYISLSIASSERVNSPSLLAICFV